jgi:hypothetical protein
MAKGPGWRDSISSDRAADDALPKIGLGSCSSTIPNLDDQNRLDEFQAFVLEVALSATICRRPSETNEDAMRLRHGRDVFKGAA